MRNSWIGSFLLLSGVFRFASPALADPILQLPIEGAAYEATSESRVIASMRPVRLRAIENTAGVRLSIAYQGLQGAAPAFALTPPTTNGSGTWIQTTNDRSSPTLSGGRRTAVEGQEFSLGNFTAKDSPIVDFIEEFPAPSPKRLGQMNVDEFDPKGFAGAGHFDLNGRTLEKRSPKAISAPFPPDAGAITVPEAGTLFLGLVTVGGCLAGSMRRKRLAR